MINVIDKDGNIKVVCSCRGKAEWIVKFQREEFGRELRVEAAQ